MSCAWCEQEVDVADRQSVRLSNAQPPWTARGFGTAAAVAASARGFLEALRTEPAIVLWFHRSCWHEFLGLLKGR